MIIRWSDNKAQNVRRQNIVIGRIPFLNNYYSLFSETPSAPSLSSGVMGLINNQPTGLLSSISSAETGALSEIQENHGIVSAINNQDTGITSTIDDDPTGIESTIQ